MDDKNLKQKIAIIGVGAVGSTIAYSLVVKNLASEIVLIDLNKDREYGEVLDMSDALSFSETGSIKAGDYSDAKDSDIIILTAGIAQKPGEDRLDLVTKNKSIVTSIFKEIGEIKSSAIIIVVSNPVDILTHLVQEISGLSKNQVFGTGTCLDSARLRSNLSRRFNVDSKQISGLVLGEHGDSEFVAWSTVSICGKSAKDMLTNEEMEEINDEVKNQVYEILNKKGATYYGIAMVVIDIVKALIHDQNRILPVSYRLEELSDEGICIGSSAVIGSSGIIRPWLTDLSDEEEIKLKESEEKIKKYI